MRLTLNGLPPQDMGEATPLATVFMELVAVVTTGVDIKGICETSKSLPEGTCNGGPYNPVPPMKPDPPPDAAAAAAAARFLRPAAAPAADPPPDAAPAAA